MCIFYFCMVNLWCIFANETYYVDVHRQNDEYKHAASGACGDAYRSQQCFLFVSLLPTHYRMNWHFLPFLFSLPLHSLQECSIFLFEKRSAEKLHKPKRKEAVTEILRNSVKQLERFRHPKVMFNHSMYNIQGIYTTVVSCKYLCLSRSISWKAHA